MKKIVILGPESTGKSTLCEQLAAHYKTSWVPEFAREYLLNNGTGYTYEDLWEIAKGQMTTEDMACSQMQEAGNKMHPTNLPAFPLFIDTDMYVLKIWSEIVFNKCDNRILKQIVQRPYDLYLLCDTDLPWIKDQLREYPELKSRQKIFQFYLDAMVNQKVPWVIISGDHGERLKQAVNAVDTLLC